ncbi:MAG TPA: hypothetical protein VGK67_00250 [Myxococcales bacterium]|jgi:hypothetical protein
MKALLAVLVVVLVPLAGRADVIPPEEDACKSATKGAACTLTTGAKGTCQDSTCTHLDYSNRPDGGPPGSKTVPCLLCLDASGKVPTGNGGGGCSLAPSGPTGRDLLALAFGGAFAGLFLLARNRRRGSEK